MPNAYRLFIDRQNGKLLRAPDSYQMASIQDMIRAADDSQIPIELIPLDAVEGGGYEPASYATDDVRLAIGNTSEAPTGGTFELVHSGNNSEAINVEHLNADVLERALNNISSIDSAGGVQVTRNALGYMAQAITNGALGAITADEVSLVPHGTVSIVELQAGSATTKGAYQINLKADPYALLTNWSLLGAASIALSTIKAGSGTQYETQRIAITGAARGGYFTISDGSSVTAALNYDASAADVEDALNGILGANTVTVDKPNSRTWDIRWTSVGDKTALTVDGALTSWSGLSGTLALNTTSLAASIAGKGSIPAVAQIVETITASNEKIVYSEDLELEEEVVSNATLTTIAAGLIGSLNGQAVFTSATRAAEIPDFVGQLGVETDTGIVYYSTSTAAGAWQNLEEMTICSNAAELAAARDNGSVTRIGINGWIDIDQDFTGPNAIPENKHIYMLGDSGFQFASSLVSSVTVDSGTNQLTLASGSLSTGDIIVLSGTTPPTGVKFQETYEVINYSGGVFQIAIVVGPLELTAIDLTSAGTAVSVSLTHALEINCPIHVAPHQLIFSGYVNGSIFGTFGGIDRYMGWWTKPYPHVTDHTLAMTTAIRGLRYVPSNVLDDTIPNDWRLLDGTSTLLHRRGKLRLFHGGMVATNEVDCQNEMIIIEGPGEYGAWVRFEDKGPDIAVTVDDGADTFTLASGSLSNGDRIALAGTTAPGGLEFKKTYEVMGYSGGVFQLTDVGQTTAIDITSTGTSVTVALCEVIGYTRAFNCTSATPGIEFRNMAVSIGRSCSPNIAIWDFPNGGFLECTRFEGAAAVIEYGGNVLRTAGSSGFNHATFARATLSYDHIDTAPFITGTIASVNVGATSANISGALGGKHIEEYFLYNATAYYLEITSGDFAGYIFGISILESAGSDLVLVDNYGGGRGAYGKGRTTLGATTTMTADLAGDSFKIWARQYGGLRELTAAQRSHFYFTSYDVKFTCDHCTILRGQYAFYISGSCKPATLALRNNHYEVQRAVVYNDSIQPASVSVIGDRFSDFQFEDKYIVYHNSTAEMILDMQATSFHAGDNVFEHTLLFDLANNGKTSDSTQVIGPEGIRSKKVNALTSAKVLRSNAGYSAYHNGSDYPVDFLNDNANTVGAFLQLDGFFRADDSTNTGDGNPVTGWSDSMVTMPDFLTQGNDPAYDINGINGYPAVSFDGTQWLKKTATGQYPFPNAEGGLLAVFQFAVNPGIDVYLLHQSLGAQFNLRYQNSNDWIRLLSGAGSFFPRSPTLTSLGTGVPIFCLYTWGANETAVTARIYSNLYNETIPGVNSATYTTLASTGATSLGAATDIYGVPVSFFLGWISDIGFWTTTPTRLQVHRALAYVKKRYGITCKRF